MYVHSFAYIYLVLFAFLIHEVIAYITVLDQGMIPLEQGSVGIQFFIDVKNNHRLGTCRVISRPKMCCLTDEEYRDCSSDTVHGDDVKMVEPQNSKTFIHVYPTLFHYDQIGSCDFTIDFKCSNMRRSRQLDVHIPFDTQLANKKKKLYLKTYTTQKDSDCDSLDEDSLHECEPVNCDLKYSGRRPYYEASRGKCVSAPVCETDVIKKLPDIVYVPDSNICRDLDHPISIGDIYAINTGLGVVTESSNPNLYDFKVILKSNCSTISENVKMLRDMMFGQLSVLNGDMSDYKICFKKAIFSILTYIIALCGLVLSVVCCLQITVWCYVKWSRGELYQYCFKNWKSRKNIHQESRIHRGVTDDLLKEVMVRDLPIELRESVVDICQRIDREIKEKKRYRVLDIGSQINLREGESQTSETSSDTSLHDGDGTTKLLN